HIGDLLPSRQFQEGEQVVDMAVNPAVRQKAVEVQLASVLLHVADGSEEGFVFKKAPIPDRLRHPGQILVDDPAGADIEVTHFGVAHLSLRQADGLAAGPKKGVGIAGPVAVKVGLFRLGDGVPVGLFPEGKAVQNDQSHRFFAPAHPFSLPAAAATSCRNDSGSRLAPPTRAPSMSASARNAPILPGFTLPPYRMRTSPATC